MDDFGDILYVLAMLAAFIFSVVKKQRKAKNNTPSPQTVEPSQGPTQEEDILDDIRELFQPKQPAEVETVKKTVQPPVIKQQVKHTVANHRKRTSVIELEDEESNAFEFDKDQIDLREAVIYAEILNRPYQ